MIPLIDLTEADIGRKVVYQSFNQQEEGTLTSWNSQFIFVRFKGPNGEACNPEDVSFSFKEPTP